MRGRRRRQVPGASAGASRSFAPIPGAARVWGRWAAGPLSTESSDGHARDRLGIRSCLVSSGPRAVAMFIDLCLVVLSRGEMFFVLISNPPEPRNDIGLEMVA